MRKGFVQGAWVGVVVGLVLALGILLTRLPDRPEAEAMCADLYGHALTGSDSIAVYRAHPFCEISKEVGDEV